MMSRRLKWIGNFGLDEELNWKAKKTQYGLLFINVHKLKFVTIDKGFDLCQPLDSLTANVFVVRHPRTPRFLQGQQRFWKVSIIHVWCPSELGECKVCPAQAIHLLPCGAPPPHPTMGERLHLLPYVWRLVVSGSWLQHKCSVLSLPSLDIGSHIFTPQSAQLSKFMLINVH